MIAIVGLGNPGPRYERTRHNAGFAVVSRLAEELGAGPWREKFHGEQTRATYSGTDLLLLRPMTFMNDSGRSVQAAMTFFRITPGELVVVHDELDLEFGVLRFKLGGGHAGHNGLRSIFQALGTGDFARLRVGIGRPARGFTGEVADYVLAEMNAIERATFADVVDRGSSALKDMVRRGLPAATNALNVRPKAKKADEADPSGAEQSESGTHEELAKKTNSR